MIPEEHLMTAMSEDELFLENLINELKKNWKTSIAKNSSAGSLAELESWLLRSGMSPASYLSQNRIGFYADFT